VDSVNQLNEILDVEINEFNERKDVDSSQFEFDSKWLNPRQWK